MRWLAFAFVLAALTVVHPMAAIAQSVNALDISASTAACGSGVTCGSIGSVAAEICVPAINPSYGGNYPRNQITIANSSPSATISVGYNSSIALNGVGTLTLGPQQTAFWPRNTAPGQPLYCIASASTTPAQIVLGQ